MTIHKESAETDRLTGTAVQSPSFLQAVQDLSLRIGLDPQGIAAGRPVRFKEVVFWLGHDRQGDPDGLTLYVDMGTVAPEFEGTIFRSLLEHNASTVAAAAGHYAVLPGSNTVVYCLRLNMTRTNDVADSIMAFIGLFSAQIRHLSEVAGQGLDKARQAWSDAVSDQVESAAADSRGDPQGDARKREAT